MVVLLPAVGGLQRACAARDWAAVAAAAAAWPHPGRQPCACRRICRRLECDATRGSAAACAIRQSRRVPIALRAVCAILRLAAVAAVRLWAVVPPLCVRGAARAGLSISPLLATRYVL